MRELTVRHETWPLARIFTISRGSRSASEVVVATIRQDGAIGRGECVPYPRYGETVEGVIAALQALAPAIAAGLDRAALQRAMPAGAARNALDCALWDLEAKLSGRPVWELAGLPAPGPVITAYTLSLDTAEAMGQAARAESHRPLLKIKLAGQGDLERVAAIHANAPNSRLIVDANEGWTPEQLVPFSAALAGLGVEMIEQPLPTGKDSALAGIVRPVPVCADESCHDAKDVPGLVGRYDFINIKLDKTGGLTEALAVKKAAEAAGLRIMVGCMVGTSLAMAPALLLAHGADIADLDGPLLMARDREHGLTFTGSEIAPAATDLWG